MKDRDLFNKEGTPIIVEGNKPLLLINPQSTYMIDKGKVAVFLTKIKDSKAIGRRHFLFELNRNDILFGLKPISVETGEYALLVSGWVGTRLLQLDKSKVFKAMTTDKDNVDIFFKTENWIKILWKSIKRAGLPKVFLKPDEIEAVSIKIDSSEKYMDLDGYEKFILEGAVEKTLQSLESEKSRFKDKVVSDIEFMENSIRKLANVNEKSKEIVPDIVTDDPLLTACGIVGKAAKIIIKHPPKSASGKVSRDPLDDIARASQIKHRRVVLKGEWWAQDSGPLLAYMEDDDRPVALVPVSPNKYRLYDSVNKTNILVDNHIAEGIKPFATAFYRPFSNAKISAKDLLIFGMESTWKRDLVTVLLLGILGGLLGMLIPVATGIIFDSVIPAGDRLQLLQIGFFLVASALTTMLFQLTRSFAVLRVEGKIEGSVQAAVWDRLLGLPVPFFKNYTSGELAMRAMGISQIRRALSGVTITTLITSIFSIFQFILLFYFSWKLAIIAFVLVLFAMLLTLVLGFIQTSRERQMVEFIDKIAGITLELINGVNKFRAAGAESRAFYLWSKEFGKGAVINIKKEKLANLLTTFNSVFPVFSAMIIFFVLQHYSDINLDPGKFIAFNAAFIAFSTTMIAMSEALLTINNIIPLYQRSKPILQSLPEYDEAKGDPGELTGEIEVSHLSFRYKEDGPLILKDISLSIKKGEYVALIGPSGSGKSTLFRILLGFEKPESGQIFYNGHDLNNIDIKAVRKQLGVVLQNGKLMQGDIYSNIIGSNPYLNLGDAIEASKRVGLYDDIKDMPMGMHTVVSDGGSTLSGGQRQRMLIARAIVNKPRILFFDEATSALDNKTQAIVSESLDNLNATRIVIAHRLSTIINCQRIIVLDQGKIVEVGTYDELMDKKGVFYELARRQLA
ncbi:MAG: bacteriocin ABC transporter ATP-binding protein [Gracilibacter sp. BRH_c7a]|nr:MAG: bacteriocin ABC transporter ATP-binding protein [Gracilibacter sp. BRH_c7a]